MTSQSDLTDLSPEERCNYGFARVRDIAFDSVQTLWRKRKAHGTTQAQVAAAIGKDVAWVSRNLRGPGNWTLRTLGAFVEALDGQIEIVVTPHEDIKPANWHAYCDYEAPLSDGNLPRMPPQTAITDANLAYITVS